MKFLNALLLAALTQVLPALAATKIMALGDSITGSPGCWRAQLWQQLYNNNIRDIDFVGTLPGQGCGFAYDGENEGHGGYLGTDIADQNMLVGWLSQTNPNIILMHLGTNDAWSNKSTAVMLTAWTKLVGQMRANNPNMKILIAQIIPLNPPTCSDCGPRVVALNAAIPAWAAGLSTSKSPITVVDQWTGFNSAVDAYDGVHPNASGDLKMAGKWYAPLVAAIQGGTTPPPTSTTKAATPTSTSTSTKAASTTAAATPTGALGGPWDQCGGNNFTGPKACVSGYKCVLNNEWYSQCLPA